MAVPSFDDFYNTVKAKLPAASDDLIRSTYEQNFNQDAVRTQGPSLEAFTAKVKQNLPDAPDALIRDTYQQQFGTSAGTAAKRAFKSAFAHGGQIIGGLVGGLGMDEAGQNIFDYWKGVEEANAPAAAQQGNVVDNPRLLLDPRFYASGFGSLAGGLADPTAYLLSGAQRAADLHNEGKLSTPKAIGLGALETALNIAPFGGASRLVNAGLMGAVTGGTPLLEAAATGDPMGQALKEGLSAAPFGLAAGLALPARAAEAPRGGQADILARMREAAGAEGAAPTAAPDIAAMQAAFADQQFGAPALTGPPDFVAGPMGVGRPGETPPPAVAPDQFALPPPRASNEFVVNPQGEAVPLTEAQAAAQAVPRQEAQALGLGSADALNARMAAQRADFEARQANPVAAPPAEKPAPPPEPAALTRDMPLADRLAHPEIRRDLAAMQNETGWAEVGGRLLRKSEDVGSPDYRTILGRTAWVPRADWWPGRPKGLTEEQVRGSIDKALAGEPLGKRETAMVQYMTDVAIERRANARFLPTQDELSNLKYDGWLNSAAPAKETVAGLGRESLIDNANESALVARATELDETRVESLAKQHEDSPNDFLAAIKSFLAETERAGTGGGGEADRGQAQAGAQGGAVPQAGVSDRVVGFASRQQAAGLARWHDDHGAMPGEPIAYFGSDPENASMAVVPEGNAYELRNNQGETLGSYPSAVQAKAAGLSVRQRDMFVTTRGEAALERQNALHREELRRDAARNAGQTSPITSNPDDLFTRAYGGEQKGLPLGHEAPALRPGTTEGQLRVGREALSDLLHYRDRRGQASVLAHSLTRDFQDKGTANLVGQTIGSPADLAALAQVYRDPRFETFRVFLMRGNEIVDHYGTTSRLPGAVSFKHEPVPELIERMNASGADGYYLQHNHPAGKASPSDADEIATRAFALQVDGFRGHVVIDHNEYAVINAQGHSQVWKHDFGGYDPLKNPRVPHDLLNKTMTSAADLADIGKALQARDGFVTLVALDSRNRVRAITEFPTALIAKGAAGVARIRRMQLASGAGASVYAVANSRDIGHVMPLVNAGIIRYLLRKDTGELTRAPRDSVLESRVRSFSVRDEPKPSESDTLTDLKPGEKNELGGGEYRLRQFANLSPAELHTLSGVVETLDKPISDQRRGTRTWDATEEAALKLIQQKYGITLDELVNRRKGSTANAEQLEAYAQILAATTRNITELAAEVRRTNSNDAKLALAAAKDKLGLMLAPALGYQTEAGRALNILRKTAKDYRQASIMFDALGDGSDKAIGDFAERIGTATNPDQVIGLTRAAYTPTLWDKFYEYWINGLLSGPTTHSVNMASNAIFQALELVAEGAASLVSKDVSAAAFKAKVAGLVHGTTLGLKNAKEALRTGEAQIGAQTQVERGPAIGGRLGKVIRIPTRLLTAEDELFKAVAYQGELASIAMRRAIAEKPADIPKRFAEIMGNVLNDPEMRLEAKRAAERATFQTKLGPVGKALSNVLSKSKVGRLIVPFVRTPTNIMKMAIEYTPAGYTQAAVREAISRGGRDAALAYSRMAIGSGIMLTMVGLAAKGLVSGNGPQDQNERALLMRQGWQPYSIKVGDKWVRYNRFDPTGTLMGVAADLHDIGAYASDGDLSKIGSMLMTSIALNLGDKTFLRGITDFANAYSDPTRYLERWAQGMAASVIPNLAAQTARGIDPYMRQSTTLLDAIKAKIPGMREQLAQKLDIAGDPVQQGGDFPGNPVQTSDQKPDALADTMLRLDVMKGKPQQSIDYKGRTIKLDDANYQAYAEFVQHARWQALTPMVSSPQFKQVMATNADAAQKILDRQYDRIGDQAKLLWLFRNPSVLQGLAAPRAPLTASPYAEQAAAR